MSRLVMVRAFLSNTEAHVAKGVLDQNGFCTFLFDYRTVEMAFQYCFAVKGLRLMVPEPELAAARSLLAESAQTVLDGDYESCVECGTDDVFRYASWIHGVIGVLMGLALILPSRRRYCQSCGARWRAPASPGEIGEVS
tara:strand:+ start:116 stop:532 length:417 start_codon:yes stop_codon:yes gene_type:complete